MITYAACTLLATLWLWYRLFQFLHIPVIKIVELLNIELPQSTKVSVDKITSDSITLHWENEPDSVISGNGVPEESHHRFKVLSYKLYLNGKLVANFPNTKRTYTCVSLRGLAPAEQYQIDLVTVNQLGFTNKLPNVFVMTLPQDAKHLSNHHISLGADGHDEAQIVDEVTHFIPTDVKWRKPLMITESSKSLTPSYSSLTTLNDLEQFSIQDLKSILVCSQEDLHDVLQQHSMVLQDFNDTKEQLQMELDNLKVQWNHEIELKKSIKSTINSLESSKVLYDLKREKLERSIKQLESKISKMNNDMEAWAQVNDVDKKKAALELSYRKTLQTLNEDISNTSDHIKSLQLEILNQEEENRKLNQAKKVIDHENIGGGNSQSLASEISSINWSAVMKKINDSTSSKSGLLSPSGEDLVNSLPSQSGLVQMIKSELEVDCKLDRQWKNSKNRFSKKIDQLEKVWKDLQATNNQLKNDLTLQTYSISRQSSQNGIQNVDLMGQPAPRPLQLHDPSSYSNFHAQGSLLAQTVASAPFSSWLQHGQHSQEAITNQDNGPSPVLSNNEVFYDNAAYEDSSHLISGLENMVSDVGDKANTMLSFTNDQLDDYWNSSSQLSRPLSPAIELNGAQQNVPNHIASMGSSQSSLSPAPQFKQPERTIQGVINETSNDDTVSFHSGLNMGHTSSPMIIPSKSVHPVPDSAFSPSFHSIWNDSSLASPHSSHHGRTDSQQKSWVFDQQIPPQTEHVNERPKENSTRRMSKLFARGTQLFRLPSHDSQ